jgi:hypothetical protein
LQQCNAPYQDAASDSENRQWRQVGNLPVDDVAEVRLRAAKLDGDFGHGENAGHMPPPVGNLSCRDEIERAPMCVAVRSRLKRNGKITDTLD